MTGARSGDLAVRGSTRTLSEVLLAAEGPYVPFARVHWRGDPNSYVDVFDVPVLTQATDGASFANVVRLPYPEPARSSSTTETTSPGLARIASGSLAPSSGWSSGSVSEAASSWWTDSSGTT